MIYHTLSSEKNCDSSSISANEQYGFTLINAWTTLIFDHFHYVDIKEFFYDSEAYRFKLFNSSLILTHYIYILLDSYKKKFELFLNLKHL